MSTLNEVMKNTADAIREKKGTAPAPPSGGESGSNVEYLVYGKGAPAAVAAYAQYLKIEAMEGTVKVVMPYSTMASELIAQMGGEIKAFGINLNERVLLVQGDVFSDLTILESLEGTGITREDIDSIPRITKEQFYDLNA